MDRPTDLLVALAEARTAAEPSGVQAAYLMTVESSHSQPLTLVVLAAGRSRRFGRPKPLEPLGPYGETLPQYTIHDAARAGFERVLLVVHPDTGDTIRDHLHSRSTGTPELSFAIQSSPDRYLTGTVSLERRSAVPGQSRSRPWGTGAAVLAAAADIDGPFAVANADDLYGPDALGAAARHLRSDSAVAGCEHALVGFRLGATLSPSGGVSRAVCQVNEAGILLGVDEVHDLRETASGIVGQRARDQEACTLGGDEWVSMNLWAFFPEIFPLLTAGLSRFMAAHGDSDDAEFLIGEAVRSSILSGAARVRVLGCDATWHGITHPGDREAMARALARLVAEGQYPAPLPGHA